VSYRSSKNISIFYDTSVDSFAGVTYPLLTAAESGSEPVT